MHDDLPDHDAPDAGSASLETSETSENSENSVTDTPSSGIDETPSFDLLAEADAENKVSTAYQVLARKYRPRTFDDLIGQEAMVRTLRNAFTSGRIAHAFMLTGVRGVGKTTTARILARALNYSTPQSQQPSTDLSEEGEHCAAIMEGRHVDVMEMDAASRTGIGDIREIIESVRYRPTSARFKVYIIDEVHMLSTAAFNGLLKTLEEPPPMLNLFLRQQKSDVFRLLSCRDASGLICGAYRWMIRHSSSIRFAPPNMLLWGMRPKV